MEPRAESAVHEPAGSNCSSNRGVSAMTWQALTIAMVGLGAGLCLGVYLGIWLETWALVTKLKDADRLDDFLDILDSIKDK